MSDHNLVLYKMEGYAGIRLKDNKPLVFKPGINLLVGRNGCGKTNLLRLVQLLTTNHVEITDRIESSFFNNYCTTGLKKKRGSIGKRLGEVKIIEHSLGGKVGDVRMSLKDRVSDENVLKNIMADGNGFHGDIQIKCDTFPIGYRQIYGSQNPPKLEMSGYLSFNLFSREHDNKAHTIMEGPIRSVSEFMKNRMLEFYEGIDFTNKIAELEDSINKIFTRFLGTTNKTVKINCSDIRRSGRISLSLMDNKNYIQSTGVSAGEASLLNLVFSLATAKDENSGVLSFDEPDIHMHDDMIQVLVKELSELSQVLPNCIIIIASHSTTMIEKLASLGQREVNVITFDGERNVANSQNDIELINALSRNGVTFSPLMLSKRQNIFIENQYSGDKSHRDFFLKFFFSDDRPNVIPIGNSGNVQNSESFSGIFEEVLKISNLNSVGVQDGDVWFKSRLIKYLQDDLTLSKFVSMLEEQKGAYIKSERSIRNSYYFNFWEIENLYLVDDLLSCWKKKNGGRLTEGKYRLFLRKNHTVITEEYFNTFYKSLVNIRVDKRQSIKQTRDFLKEKFTNVNDALHDGIGLRKKMKDLTDVILSGVLINWVPGKEIKKLLEREGYFFDDSGFDFEILKVSAQLREILSFALK